MLPTFITKTKQNRQTKKFTPYHQHIHCNIVKAYPSGIKKKLKTWALSWYRTSYLLWMWLNTKVFLLTFEIFRKWQFNAKIWSMYYRVSNICKSGMTTIAQGTGVWKWKHALVSFLHHKQNGVMLFEDKLWLVKEVYYKS